MFYYLILALTIISSSASPDDYRHLNFTVKFVGQKSRRALIVSSTISTPAALFINEPVDAENFPGNPHDLCEWSFHLRPR